MNESRTLTASMRRILLPLLVAVALVAGTVLFSGSALIRVEDVALNRILAGTYGTPDWRVQEMNPLLAQLITLLYRIIPSINWYGVLLLALLACAAATAISLAARKPGGFWPAVIIASPIVVLLANSVISPAIAGLCAATGAFSLMDGLQRRKEGIGALVAGILLFVLGAALSLQWAILVGVAAALCWLPGFLHDGRMRGFAVGLPLMAVIVAALFGYSSLMYNSAELSAYRSNYALYESVQHSSLKDEADMLLATYGISAYSADEHADHDHAEGEIPEDETIMPPNVFDTVGWTLNDASLFFTRYSSDAKLVDPDALATLNAEATHWDFTPSRLFSGLLATMKKPQFLLLAGLFILSAAGVLITHRGRGLTVLLAALFAFGGHVAMIAHYYDSFADIAPFYLLAIVAMLFSFDGESAKGWLHRAIKAPGLRIGLSALVMAGFVAVLGGLLYYTHITPANPGQSTAQAAEFLSAYIAEHDESVLLIGENPSDRYKPQTLDTPVRGADRSLLAGSYDLYSPRRAAMMEQFGIENPLPDSLGREDIAYVVMGFVEPVTLRLISEYDIYATEPKVLYSQPDFAEMVIQMQPLSAEEVDSLLANIEAIESIDDAAIEELNAILEKAIAEGAIQLEEHNHEDEDEEHDHDHEEEEDHDHDHEEEEDHDHDHEEDAASVAPAASATPNA